MPITALYAALLAPLFILLSARIIQLRRTGIAAFGDGGNPELQRRIRVQANFTEYVPFALILMALAESEGASPPLLHLLGLALLAGRLCHAYGVSQSPNIMPLRVAGVVLTAAMMAVAALACLIFYFVGVE